MATKYTVSERTRFGLFLLLNPMQHPNRAERKRTDRLWDELALDDVAAKVDGAAGQIGHLGFSETATIEAELTSDQRDLLLSIFDKPGVTTAVGRLVEPLESELLKRRDGEAAAG